VSILGSVWKCRWRDRHEVTIFGHEHCATRLDDRSAFRPTARWTVPIRRCAAARRSMAACAWIRSFVLGPCVGLELPGGGVI
jgi:hypothetical protein